MFPRHEKRKLKKEVIFSDFTFVNASDLTPGVSS